MPNRSQILALLLLSALPLALAVAGCGADDSAEASISKAQFRKQANLICNKGSIEQYEKANRYLEDHPKAKEADLVEPAGISPLEKELEELQALGVPRGYEEEAEAFLDEFERALEELKEDPRAAVSSGGNPFEKANKLSEKYKFGDCSDSP
jgi:hypothetical protein